MLEMFYENFVLQFMTISIVYYLFDVALYSIYFSCFLSLCLSQLSQGSQFVIFSIWPIVFFFYIYFLT